MSLHVIVFNRILYKPRVDYYYKTLFNNIVAQIVLWYFVVNVKYSNKINTYNISNVVGDLLLPAYTKIYKQ